jgi:hypothetical protein
MVIRVSHRECHCTCSAFQAAPAWTYNFCNAHYDLPPNATATGGQLVHVSVVMRHHKVRGTHGGASLRQPSLMTRQRTPDNLAPSERALNPPMGWARADAVQHTHDRGSAAIAHDSLQLPIRAHDLVGSCDAWAAELRRAPRLVPARAGAFLSTQTLTHAPKTGLWVLYHDCLKFLNAVEPAAI